MFRRRARVRVWVGWVGDCGGLPVSGGFQPRACCTCTRTHTHTVLFPYQGTLGRRKHTHARYPSNRLGRPEYTDARTHTHARYRSGLCSTANPNCPCRLLALHTYTCTHAHTLCVTQHTRTRSLSHTHTHTHTHTGDGWSPRWEDAVLHGCVPVVIMDDVQVGRRVCVCVRACVFTNKSNVCVRVCTRLCNVSVCTGVCVCVLGGRYCLTAKRSVGYCHHHHHHHYHRHPATRSHVVPCPLPSCMDGPTPISLPPLRPLPSPFPQVVFESLIDVSLFSLRIAESDLGRVVEVLKGVSEVRLAEMQAHLAKVWHR